MSPQVTGIHRFILNAFGAEPSSAPRNNHTRMVDRAELPALEPLALRQIFRHRLDAIRRAYRGTPQNACLVCAIDPSRGVAASVRLMTPEGAEPAFLTIGRHERCQLRLTDPALSLRHATLVVRRLPEGDLCVRLLDLRSGLGMVGEDGRTLESVSVEGHLFVGIGRYVIMILLGGEDLAFSDDGGEVYDALPARVFFDQRERVQQGPITRAPRALLPANQDVIFASGTRTAARARGIAGHQSRVDIHRAAEPLRQPSNLLDGDRRGTLTVACSAGSASVPLYDAQVRDGVLLGRYERCESADLPFDLPDTVSRVHALVLAEGDKLYVMDTASTFGVRTANGDEVPGIKLDAETHFTLGTDTDVHWLPSGS